MAGELVPLVLIPRYTTYAGNDHFTTIGMDVTEYETAIVNVWCGDLVGTGGTVNLYFEESTDQNNWNVCYGVTDPEALTTSTEEQFTPTLGKRWFRIRLVLPNADNVLTAWAVGFLQERTT
jgi:hypothetical protein